MEGKGDEDVRRVDIARRASSVREMAARFELTRLQSPNCPTNRIAFKVRDSSRLVSFFINVFVLSLNGLVFHLDRLSLSASVLL